MFIYKLESSHTDAKYVGKTTTTLKQRLSAHRSSYKGHLAGKNRIGTCIAILKYTDVRIVCLEKVADKSLLAARERYWIENTPACVNKVIPTRTQMQYYWANPKYRESQRALMRERYQRDRASGKVQEYYSRPEVKARCKETQRARRNQNKDKINAHKREILHKYKETLNRKMTCGFCGKEFMRRSRYEHYRSVKCTNTRREQYARRTIFRFLMMHL